MSSQLWKLDEIYVEDLITDSGADWNFDQHKKIDAMPTLADFKKTVSDYLSWEVSQILKKDSPKQSLISERIANLEREFKASGGKFEEFRIGDIFEIQTPKRKFDANKIQFGGQYPYVARGDKNNGIRGYINENTQYLNDKNTISFGQDTATMFFQRDKYFTGDKIKIFKPINFGLNSRLANYIIASMRRGFSNFAWGSSSFNVEILKDVKIILPTLGGEINFSFMEKFIEELERERVEELDAYLAVTGLRDYKLTEKEKDALAKFDKFSQWGGVASEFKINDLLEKLELKFLKNNFDKARDISKIQTVEFDLPLVNAKDGDNGIMYYGRKRDFQSASMTIDIVNDGAVSTGNVYAQPQETGVLYNAYLVKPKTKNTTKELLLFFATSMQKSIKYKFGYENKAGWNKVRNEFMFVPTLNDEIDYEFMENFIKAIEKLVIKDVVLWADKKIEATKEVVSKI